MPTDPPRKRVRHKGHTKRSGVALVETPRDGWIGRWVDPVSGKRKQATMASLDKRSAKARQEWAESKSAELQAERDRLSGIVPDGDDTKPSAVVEMHLEGLTPNSRQSRQAPLRRMAAMLERASIRSTLKVDGPTMTRVRDLFAKEVKASGEPYADASRQFAISVTATFWRWARKRGFAVMTKDTIDDAHESIRLDQEMPEVLQPAEVQQVLDVAIEHDTRQTQFRMASPYLLALILCGCRPHELRKIEWSAVQLDAGRLIIRAAGRKTGRARFVTFIESPALGPLLAAIRKVRKPSLHAGPFGYGKSTERVMVERLIGYRIDDDGNPLCLPDGFQLVKIRRTVASVLATAPKIGATIAAMRGGHDIRVLQKNYLGHVIGVGREATTIESMLGIESRAKRIIELVKER